jgi:hypothetical protein
MMVGDEALQRESYAAILRMYGVVLYNGILPNLSKVEPRDTFDAGPFRFVGGRIVARRSLEDTMLAIALGLTQARVRGKVLDAARVQVWSAEVSKLKDLEFLAMLGAPWTEWDVRFMATDRTGTYYVGSCVTGTRGKRLAFRGHCWSKFEGLERVSKCQDATPELPLIMWGTDPAATHRSLLFLYAEPGNPAACHEVFYDLAENGTVGAHTADRTKPAD